MFVSSKLTLYYLFTEFRLIPIFMKTLQVYEKLAKKPIRCRYHKRGALVFKSLTHYLCGISSKVSKLNKSIVMLNEKNLRGAPLNPQARSSFHCVHTCQVGIIRFVWKSCNEWGMFWRICLWMFLRNRL